MVLLASGFGYTTRLTHPHTVLMWDDQISKHKKLLHHSLVVNLSPLSRLLKYLKGCLTGSKKILYILSSILVIDSSTVASVYKLSTCPASQDGAERIPPLLSSCFFRRTYTQTYLLGGLEHCVPKDLPKKTPREVASNRLFMVGFLVFPVDLQGGLHFETGVFGR